jgi:hypothetical protein
MYMPNATLYIALLIQILPLNLLVLWQCTRCYLFSMTRDSVFVIDILRPVYQPFYATACVVFVVKEKELLRLRYSSHRYNTNTGRSSFSSPWTPLSTAGNSHGKGIALACGSHSLYHYSNPAYIETTLERLLEG